MAQIELYLRLGVFFGVLIAMILWEYSSPRRQNQKRFQRWPANLLLVVINTMILRLVLPGIAVVTVLFSAHYSLGLFTWLEFPPLLEGFAIVILLDLAIYWQHRLFHHIPLMWRIHRMHHSDTEYDVTTGARFHPIEIILSVLIKIAMVALLGASFWAVVVFEILLNASSMFNHSNIKLPAKVDKLLRSFIVTPDMHRVHHSIHAAEHHQNFGFSLSIWDHLFNSYCAQPKEGHLAMQIGLPYFRASGESRLDKMLTQPFRDM